MMIKFQIWCCSCWTFYLLFNFNIALVQSWHDEPLWRWRRPNGKLIYKPLERRDTVLVPTSKSKSSHILSSPHNDHMAIFYDKVDRCLARYSPRAIITNQQGTKWTGKAYMCQRKHILDKFSRFWPTFLIFTGGSKSFRTQITKNHLKCQIIMCCAHPYAK